MKRYGVALMFLRAYGRSPCPYVLKHIWSYVLMFLCSYVLMFSALADCYKQGYAVAFNAIGLLFLWFRVSG